MDDQPRLGLEVILEKGEKEDGVVAVRALGDGAGLAAGAALHLDGGDALVGRDQPALGEDVAAVAPAMGEAGDDVGGGG